MPVPIGQRFHGRGIMDISGLAPGVYIIRVEIEGKKYIGKLSVI
jgi:hypothetical protein